MKRTSSMRVGVHVSIVGGLLAALERARTLSCNTMQIFSRSPRGGPAPRFTQEQLSTFTRERRAAGIEPLIVHGPYIINLASPDETIWNNSVDLFQQEYARCHALQAHYLVAHVGSHRGQGEALGIRRVAEALNRTLNDHPAARTRAKGERSGPMILLENTAGSGQGLGFTFEQLRAMRAKVNRKEAIGVCLDTAHLFAAGYPIHTSKGLEDVLEQCDRILGLARVKVMHLNDSKSAFDSHVDRHWHLGEGHIGLQALRRIVTHPRLRRLPFILETPKKREEDDPRNLATVRRLYGGLSALRA